MCYCPDQNPTEFARTCQEKLSKKALQEAFVPTYTRMKRYQGQWHKEEGIAFPDYIFLESKDEKLLFRELEQYENTPKQITCLSSEQEEFLSKVFGEKKHLDLSKGHIESGCTYVTQGPLQGKEALISRIDRHKRLAKLKIPVGNNSQEMYAGLEIISKN